MAVNSRIAYLCLEEGEQAKERKNYHGKLTKEMMPEQSCERSLSWGQEQREYKANGSRDIWAGSCQYFRIVKLGILWASD